MRGGAIEPLGLGMEVLGQRKPLDDVDEAAKRSRAPKVDDRLERALDHQLGEIGCPGEDEVFTRKRRSEHLGVDRAGFGVRRRRRDRDVKRRP